MIVANLQDRSPGDVVFVAGTGYIIQRIVGDVAYVIRQNTAGRNTYVIGKEGIYYTVSVLKGDKAQPWDYCGILHYLKPVDIYPDLE